MKLEGVLLKPGDGVQDRQTAVVLAHMFPADQTSWWPFAGRLASEGYTALTFNFRGYGRSQGSKDIEHLDRDLEAALEHVRAQGFSRVYLVGASMGGTAAVIVAARQDLTGIATLSAPQAFRGLDATPAAAQVTEPALFIAAEGDRGAPEAAKWYAKSAGASAQTLIVPGGEHGTVLLEGPSHDQVEKALLSFFREPAASSR